ncbi:hypothetical protein ACS0TY_029834 [Phlomoides rotata]
MSTWAAVVVVAVQLVAHVEGIGVNWGTQTTQPLNPSYIVQMLKDNNINKVKLFDSDHWTVSFFAKTDIEVMLGIPNNQLESLAEDYDNAKDWVKENLTKAYNEGVKIGYVAVANEPFLTAYNGSNIKTTFPALKNIQRAINEAGLGDKIKATIPQNADVYESGTAGPSAGNFRSDIRQLMIQIVQFLRDNDAPFVVNIYPFLSLSLNPDFPIEFAFFDGGAKPVQDKGTTYTNVLDANLDTLVWSLKKANAEKVPIIIGEIGWPTDGDNSATVDLAKKFYNGFFKKMATKKGTPKYPKDIEYYLFSLTDENQKSVAPGEFERHWGVFQYDGQPKFPIDVTGGGNPKMPVGAKNVKYLESKWCVLDSEVTDLDKVQSSVEYACNRGDCTTLTHKSACSKLDRAGKASYAFNMYFQMNSQDVESCDFDGFARIVEQNASTGDCLFPIEIESVGWRLGVHITSALLPLLFALFFLFF